MNLGRFFLGDSSIWSFPSVSPLSDCNIWWAYFDLAIIVFGTFEFIVSKKFYRSGKMDKRSLDSLIEGGPGGEGLQGST